MSKATPEVSAARSFRPREKSKLFISSVVGAAGAFALSILLFTQSAEAQTSATPAGSTDKTPVPALVLSNPSDGDAQPDEVTTIDHFNALREFDGVTNSRVVAGSLAQTLFPAPPIEGQQEVSPTIAYYSVTLDLPRLPNYPEGQTPYTTTVKTMKFGRSNRETAPSADLIWGEGSDITTTVPIAGDAIVATAPITVSEALTSFKIMAYDQVSMQTGFVDADLQAIIIEVNFFNIDNKPMSEPVYLRFDASLTEMYIAQAMFDDVPGDKPPTE